MGAFSGVVRLPIGWTGDLGDSLRIRRFVIVRSKSQPWAGGRVADGRRATLAEIDRRLGRQKLQPVACIAKPDTILAWYCEPGG
jgi:hypothetical protein